MNFFIVILGTTHLPPTTPLSGGGIAYSNQDYCTFLVILLSGGEPQGQGENVQTPLEGPFADPTQGAGTDSAELGTRHWSHIMSPAGFEPRDLPAGEMFGNATTNPLRHPAPLSL